MAAAISSRRCCCASSGVAKCHFTKPPGHSYGALLLSPTISGIVVCNVVSKWAAIRCRGAPPPAAAGGAALLSENARLEREVSRQRAANAALQQRQGWHDGAGAGASAAGSAGTAAPPARPAMRFFAG
eukprot:gene32156-42994_t